MNVYPLSTIFSLCNLLLRMVREKDCGSSRAKREVAEILPGSEINFHTTDPARATPPICPGSDLIYKMRLFARCREGLDGKEKG